MLRATGRVGQMPWRCQSILATSRATIGPTKSDQRDCRLRSGGSELLEWPVEISKQLRFVSYLDSTDVNDSSQSDVMKSISLYKDL